MTKVVTTSLNLEQTADSFLKRQKKKLLAIPIVVPLFIDQSLKQLGHVKVMKWAGNSYDIRFSSRYRFPVSSSAFVFECRVYKYLESKIAQNIKYRDRYPPFVHILVSLYISFPHGQFICIYVMITDLTVLSRPIYYQPVPVYQHYAKS